MRNLLRICNRLAAAAVLLLAGASSLLAVNRIEVLDGRHGGTCGVGNPNAVRYSGYCGAQVTIDSGVTPAYVQDNTPANEGAYRVRFYVNAQTLSFTSGSFDVFAGYDGTDVAAGAAPTGANVLHVKVDAGSPNQLTVSALLDSAAEHSVGPLAFTNGWHSVEIEWARATAVGANNGHLNVWLDNVSQAGGSNTLDNDTRSVNLARWGFVSQVGATLSGTFRMDDYVSQRTGFIGPAPFTGGVTPGDFDGNGASDVFLHRNGSWPFFTYSTGAAAGTVVTGTAPGCVEAVGDYAGDGSVDLSQLCGGAWHFYNPNGTYNKGIWTGASASDIPAPADYDGDGATNVVLYSSGAWIFYDYATGAYLPGSSVWTGGIASPVSLDFDGDGATDFSLYAAGAWHFFNDNGTYIKGIWIGNTAGNVPVPFDRNGDGREDPVIFNGNTWHFFDYPTSTYAGGVVTPRPGGGAYTNPQPTPLDVDGDGIYELGVYEVVAGNGAWHFFSNGGAFLKTINTGAASSDHPISRRTQP